MPDTGALFLLPTAVRRIAFAAVAAVALQPSPAGAIVANPLPRVCNEYPHSDYVFSGTVISEGFSKNEYGRDEGARTYRLRVDHIFKGRVPHLARLITPADSGGGALDAGQPAIVFARGYRGRIAFSGSSNTESGAGVAKVIAQIRSYLAHPPKVATIAGRVDGPGNMGPKGTRLFLTNGKSRLFVRTDAQGVFLTTVAPGRWWVRIAEPGWASRSGVYSYDFTMPIHLAKGGCADVELETGWAVKNLTGTDWMRWHEKPARARR